MPLVRPITKFIRQFAGGKRGFPSRRGGDAARAQRDWARAAEQYSLHLDMHPQDDEIWIQLGHMLKEKGTLDQALAAYETALSRRPNDSDLLVNLGHVHKLMGDRGHALSLYRRSAEIDGNRDALIEIDRMEGNGDAAGVMTDEERAKLLALVSGFAVGLYPIDIAAIRMEDTSGRLRFFSQDPWVSFLIDMPIAEKAGLAILTIEANPMDPRHRLTGQVYLDYGNGFEERLSLPYFSGAEPVSLLIAAPEKIRALRWDPDRKSNVIHTPKLSIAPATDRREIEALIRGRAAADIEVEPLIDLALSYFDGYNASSREAAEASLM
ncbi:MAG: tetratricopeptide repeat protein, partial [Pseudomonadota bacterium]|nr:tetratricopeptide repeat protein [Pseudomonadota bacterium]